MRRRVRLLRKYKGQTRLPGVASTSFRRLDMYRLRMAEHGRKTQTSDSAAAAWPVRIAILAVFVALIVTAYAAGWHRQLSLESLIAHRDAIEAFVAAHFVAALALYVGVYVASISLFIPASLLLTVTGGILFGAVVGPLAAIAGATSGATAVFLIARTALGEGLLRRAGPFAARFAAGFSADAFSYLLFMRVVPVIPFWLVNLTPALFGVSAVTFIGATLIGNIPAAFVFGVTGARIDEVFGAQEAAYRACVAAGGADCRLNFDLREVLTGPVLASFVALGAIALITVIWRRLRARRLAKSTLHGP
jgi:uncharacterized membrane protein YdjX (TVP38/TMEM64 family)